MSDDAALLFIVIVFLLIIWFITKDDAPDPRKVALRFLDGLANLLTDHSAIQARLTELEVKVALQKDSEGIRTSEEKFPPMMPRSAGVPSQPPDDAPFCEEAVMTTLSDPGADLGTINDLIEEVRAVRAALDRIENSAQDLLLDRTLKRLILPINTFQDQLDHMDGLLANSPELHDSFRVIGQAWCAVLDHIGLEAIVPVPGTPLDPLRHHVVEAPPDKPTIGSNPVIESVARRGWRAGKSGALLRCAEVSISWGEPTGAISGKGENEHGYED